MSLIKLNNLTGNISSNDSTAYVADKISLEIEKDSTIGILGESGSGKTQLAMTIAGLNTAHYKMESGTIEYTFDDSDPFKVTSNKSDFDSNQIPFSELSEKLKKDKIYGNKIGIMFQDPGKSLNPFWTIGRHVEEIILTKDSSKKQNYETRQNDIFKALKLDVTFDKRYPNQLSGGQQQRVVIALVLLSEPDIIIADEVATGLDASVKRELLDYFLYVKNHTKSSLLIISHDIGLLTKISDRVILMYKGAAIQSLDADIIKSVILVTQFYNSPFFKSNDDLKNKINSDSDFDSISKELHPYLKGLLRSHIFKVPLSGDIPDPKKRTGNKCPFTDRCSDSSDECEESFPNLKLKNHGWVRCFNFDENNG